MNPDLPNGADARVETGPGSAALLWWTTVPSLPGERLGVIGAFAAVSATAAGEVLGRALERLRAEGCTQAVGPMDGNTWRKYRFVTESTDEPPFLLEPANPPEWPEWWRQHGFTPLAEYCSAVTTDLVFADPRLPERSECVRAAGIALRPLEPAQFDAELERIHAVSLAAFPANFLYTPLPREEFAAQYRAIRPLVRPELVLLAERAGEPVGFMFAVPEPAAAGTAPDRVIMKTIAVRPDLAGLGLGTVLFAAAHAAARRLGYRRAVHALMHQDNRSRRLSAHAGRIFRRYTLFARRLGP